LKVDGENTPSHEELIQIIDKTSHYVKSSKTNYTYISNINTFIDSTDHVEENIIEKTNSSKKKKSEKLSSKNKKEPSLSLIIIIGITIICLIVIIIGIIFFYKKYFKEDDQLAKQLSDSSHESQNSVSSIKSQSDLPPSPVKQFHNKKPKPGRQAAANWFKLDEDI
jgi:cytoskeletal protein RodZ